MDKLFVAASFQGAHIILEANRLQSSHFRVIFAVTVIVTIDTMKPTGIFQQRKSPKRLATGAPPQIPLAHDTRRDPLVGWDGQRRAYPSPLFTRFSPPSVPRHNAQY